VFPVLNHDATQLAYESFEGPRERSIYVVSTSGGGLPRKVCQPCGMPRDWFRDGRRLLVQTFSRGRPTVEVLDIETQKSYEVLSAEEAGVHRSRLSPDEKWIAFTHRIDANSSRIMIAPFHDGESTPQSEWIAVTEGTSVDDGVAWSPDGRRLYFRSDRSGFVGLYTRALDAATKQPTGEVQVVRDFRQITRSMGDIDPNVVSVAVTRDALIFPLAEWSGDVWLMQPRAETPPEPVE
jgi:Tol biopolymer transport system component